MAAGVSSSTCFVAMWSGPPYGLDTGPFSMIMSAPDRDVQRAVRNILRYAGGVTPMAACRCRLTKEDAAGAAEAHTLGGTGRTSGKLVLTVH